MVMLTKEQIKELRLGLGLTAAELGELLGVTGNTIFRWELGIRHPKWCHLEALNVLKAELDERSLVA